MHQGVVHVHQKLFTGLKQWDVYLLLWQDKHGWEKDLRFTTTHPITLPQPFISVDLVHILG